VSPADFDTWVAGQRATAAFPVGGAVTPAATPPAAATAQVPAGAAAATPTRPTTGAATSAQTAAAQAPSPGAPAPAAPAPAEPWSFPREKVPPHIIPATPIPRGVSISDAVIAAGDAQRGFETYSRSACIGCHKIRGNPMSLGIIGPDLTHVGSRYTIAGGFYVNDARHLAHWIKNSRVMKPGSLMQTLGKGEYDPIMQTRVSVGGLTDEQIADVTAYLLSLK
jgi:cytochrome c oxidase subunit 2